VLAQMIKGVNEKPQELIPVEFDNVDFDLAGKP
jgi:hypothetical protein